MKEKGVGLPSPFPVVAQRQKANYSAGNQTIPNPPKEKTSLASGPHESFSCPTTDLNSLALILSTSPAPMLSGHPSSSNASRTAAWLAASRPYFFRQFR